MLEFRATERGFRRAEFKDHYGAACSIQQSSLATEDAIWLGCDNETVDQNGTPCGARMHLTRALAVELAMLLTWFATTGQLPPENV